MTGNPKIDAYILIALSVLALALKFLGALYALLTGLALVFHGTKAGPVFARWGAAIRKVQEAAGPVEAKAEAVKVKAPSVPPGLSSLLFLLVLGVPMLAGCPQQYPDPLASETGDDRCGTDALAKLIAGKARDLSAACAPAKVAKCSPLLKDPVEAKWKPEFDAWEACQ